MLFLKKFFAAIALGVALLAAPMTAHAQLTPAQQTQLDAAIATGDTAAIGALINAAGGNAAATEAIATALLAAAQNPATPASTAAMFAAAAINSGGLSGTQQIAAFNAAFSNPAGLVVLANNNAPDRPPSSGPDGMLVQSWPLR
ncbi:MAG: hypothetical protein FJX02_14390 [Alphaproteobacteria bacterium]|nr:hypothetical protein [Alphaproteobacteria bacterium]